MSRTGRRIFVLLLAAAFAGGWWAGGHWAWGLTGATAGLLALLFVMRPAGPSPAVIEIDRLLSEGRRDEALLLVRKSLRDAAGDWEFRLKVVRALADAGERVEARAALRGGEEEGMSEEARDAVESLRRSLERRISS